MRDVAEVEPINLTPMIDIVFQMVIFFILTLDLDKEKFTEHTKLGEAPDGKAVEENDPRTVYIEVAAKGQIMIAQTPLSESRLLNMLLRARKKWGQSVPVVVYADYRVEHSHIKRALDVVSKSGLYDIKFAAIKEYQEK